MKTILLIAICIFTVCFVNYLKNPANNLSTSKYKEISQVKDFPENYSKTTKQNKTKFNSNINKSKLNKAIKILVICDSLILKKKKATNEVNYLISETSPNEIKKNPRVKIINRIRSRFLKRKKINNQIISRHKVGLADKINTRINYTNKEVRNYAISQTRGSSSYSLERRDSKYFYQSFMLFNSIVRKWNYVSDPENEEYFAYASETLNHFSGDCDDYSIFMATCLKSIGRKVRLIHTSGHLYPELFIGDNYKNIQEAVNVIKKLYKEDISAAHFHQDKNGDYWINLDYTRNHPGGKFLKPDILEIISL